MKQLIFLIIAVVLAIAATVLAFIFIVPEKRREKLNAFGKFLHDLCAFKFLVVEKILQALYIFSTAFIVLYGVLQLFNVQRDYWTGASRWMGGTGLLCIIVGPIAVRLSYELMMMAILLLKNVIPKHMDCISAKLTEMGVTVEEEDDTLLVSRSGPLQRTNVKTQPYPGFPTDMQPQIAVVLSLAQGTSLVTEGVYGANRFKYMDELRRMGGQVQVDGRVAVIEGVEYLTGAPVQACDLRAGAALVIAGLAARGVTELTQVQFIERGYEDLVGKLRSVGADIRVEEIPEAQEAEATMRGHLQEDLEDLVVIRSFGAAGRVMASLRGLMDRYLAAYDKGLDVERTAVEKI